jgi:hypothetical protein
MSMPVVPAMQNQRKMILNSFGWFSPIYKHLDLLKEAEAFVAQQVTAKKSATNKPATSITCVKGKLTKKFIWSLMQSVQRDIRRSSSNVFRGPNPAPVRSI